MATATHFKTFTGAAVALDKGARLPFPMNDLGVCLIEWMAFLAMGLGKVLGLNCVAANGIFPNRHNLHVCRIYTKRRSAQMVNYKSGSNGADQEFVRKTVGKFLVVKSDAESSVALMDQSVPEPAGFRLAPIHESPKPLINGFRLLPQKDTSAHILLKLGRKGYSLAW